MECDARPSVAATEATQRRSGRDDDDDAPFDGSSSLATAVVGTMSGVFAGGPAPDAAAVWARRRSRAARAVRPARARAAASCHGGGEHAEPGDEVAFRRA